jgi:hypothetical protein
MIETLHYKNIMEGFFKSKIYILKTSLTKNHIK